MLSPTRPVSLLVAASHRLRKGRMGLTSGQCALAQIPLFAMHCGAKEENAVLVPKPLKINGSRSVHAELGVTGVTFPEVSSGGRYGTRLQRA
jgi:hypothetical protein